MGTTLFLKVWERIRTSFWFVPSVMILGALALLVGTISLDYGLPRQWVESIACVYAGGPEGARALLSTVAGSMMTVTGVVFSVTVVAFTLASQQFSPRLLRNFMRDPGNQIVLGTFMSTFVYCLLVLRTVRKYDGEEFVPHISVTCATFLAILSIGVLVYFVHHAAASMQAPTIIGNVARELEQAIDRLFPADLGKQGATEEELNPVARDLAEKTERDGAEIVAPKSGYLEGMDGDGLLAVARRRDVVLQCLARPGDFVSKGEPVLKVWPAERGTDEIKSKLLDAVLLGSQRTQEQDLEFVVQQLVEIALRALSPSLNDPFTAVACIDRLRTAFIGLANAELPKPYRFDQDGRLRMIARAPTFRGLLDAAFDPLRRSGRTSVAVTIRLLETLEAVGRRAGRQEDRAAMLRQARMIEEGSREAIAERNDREDIGRAYAAACAALSRG